LRTDVAEEPKASKEEQGKPKPNQLEAGLTEDVRNRARRLQDWIIDQLMEPQAVEDRHLGL